MTLEKNTDLKQIIIRLKTIKYMCKSATIFLLLFILSTQISFSQQPQWLKSLNTSDNLDTLNTQYIGNPYFVDKSGNAFLSYNYYGSLSMNGVSTTSSSNAKSFNDYALFKINTQGNAEWVKSNPSQGGYGVISISSDDNSGCLLVGEAQKNPTTIWGKSLNTNGKGSLFLARIDSGGNVTKTSILAQNTTSKASFSALPHIIMDRNKNIYLFETYFGPVVFDTFSRKPAASEVRICMVKYDSSGQALWINSNLNANFSLISSAEVDSKGNMYVAGTFNGNLYQNNTLVLQNNSIAGAADAFIAKFDSSGQFLWAGHIQGPGAEGISGLAIDDSNNIYATGSYSGQMAIGNTTIYGSTNASYLCRFNKNGTFSWVKDIKTDNVVENTTISAINENIYITGWFNKHVFINRDTITNTVTNKDSNTAFSSFFVKYDSSGNPLKYTKISSSTGSFIDGVTAYGSNIYGYGIYLNDMTLNNLSLSYPGKANIFLFNISSDFTGINEEIQQNEGVKIYPNPNSGHFILHTSYPVEFYEILDMDGKAIYRNNGDGGNGAINIDLNLANGMYMIKVVSVQGSSVKKFIVNN